MGHPCRYQPTSLKAKMGVWRKTMGQVLKSSVSEQSWWWTGKWWQHGREESGGTEQPGPRRVEKQYCGSGIWEWERWRHFPILRFLGVEDQKLRLGRAAGYGVTLGRARLRYEEKKKLAVSSGLEVGKQMILSLKSLESQGQGQRQGGPEHNGKDETLTKWWSRWLILRLLTD